MLFSSPAPALLRLQRVARHFQTSDKLRDVWNSIKESMSRKCFMVQSWYHSHEKFIQDVFVYLEFLKRKPPYFCRNSGSSSLCEAPSGGEWPLPLIPRLGLSATATPEELKRLGAEKMLQIVKSFCCNFHKKGLIYQSHGSYGNV